MSIFGKLDAANVQTNPYFIEKGNYPAEVTKAQFKDNRDGDKQLVITYTIDDDSSEYDGKLASQYFTLPDPELTSEMFELLPSDDKKRIRNTLASMKRTLCGNDANPDQKGLGVSPDDLNDDDWNPEVLVGTKVTIGIGNYGPNNEGVNVKFVNLLSD